MVRKIISKLSFYYMYKFVLTMDLSYLLFYQVCVQAKHQNVKNLLCTVFEFFYVRYLSLY